MKVGIHTGPLKTNYRVQGTGVYVQQLLINLKKYDNENEFIAFERLSSLPNDIDLIHYPYFNPFFLTLPIRKAKPTVVTVHDLAPLVFPKRFPSGIRGRLKWKIQKFSLKQVDAVISDSYASKRDIARFTSVSERKITVVHLAANDQFRRLNLDRKTKSKLLKKYNLPEKFVLYVGDVTWNKNVPRLIEAVKKINVTLVLVGRAMSSKNVDVVNPWNRDLIRAQKLIENDRRFIRLGFVETGDLVFLYNVATVLAMPSLYEGFGLPILEAMSCGCPVVTTREGSLPEVAGDAPWYVDAYDRESIANGVGEVFFNEKLRSVLTGKSLQHAKKFSWKKTAGETVHVYKRVVENIV